MRTIVEPKEHIDKLWGKQQIREGDTYRMMRYVLRVDHDGKVLLHNVVTGRLVVLEQDEAEVVDKLPLKYEPVLEQMVAEHYLVPEGCDEHQQVANLRSILNHLHDVQSANAGITHYTILPTTACNARCYYCFEKGVKSATMSSKTIDDLVSFMDLHCGNRKYVRISWFGGEPTVSADVISRICEGLAERSIQYDSDITTNGYLLDEAMADVAKELWHVRKAMICFDGMEKRYNETKAYVNPQGSPYQRVMQNIGYLLDREIYVNLRMNFDLNNYLDFADLVKEAEQRFGHSPYLQMRAHPVNGVHADHQGNIAHGTEEWFIDKVVELGNITRTAGYMKWYSSALPWLNYKGCQANDNRSATITPEGSIVRCPEQFGAKEVTGNISEGQTNANLIQAWKEIADYSRCADCVMYPFCFQLVRCSTKDYCTYTLELKQGVHNTVCHIYDYLQEHQEGGDLLCF